MKLIGYVRASTASKPTKGAGLDVQRATIRRWAEAHEHRIVQIVSDEGQELAHRPGLLEAFTLLREGKAAGLVVYRLDRLARDVGIQEAVLRDVQRLHAELLSTSDAEANLLVDDPADATRRLIRQVVRSVAAYDRSMIAMRLRESRDRKAARDGYPGGGPAYGRQAVGGALVDHQGERAVIDRMVILRRDGLSLPKIIQTLNAEGLRPKRGGSWHPTTVARILQREAKPRDARQRTG